MMNILKDGSLMNLVVEAIFCLAKYTSAKFFLLLQSKFCSPNIWTLYNNSFAVMLSAEKFEIFWCEQPAQEISIEYLLKWNNFDDSFVKKLFFF